MKSFWKIADSARREIAMRGLKTIVILSAVVVVELVVVTGLCISEGKAESKLDVTLRELAPQTVLYTIHRGHCADLCPTINRLYKLALAKGLRPCGSPSMGYLNSPVPYRVSTGSSRFGFLSMQVLWRLPERWVR